MSALNFLIAAKQCEIADLAGLARTVALVEAVARAVHALQRERGLSCLFVGSGGEGFVADLHLQQAGTDADMLTLRDRLEALDIEAVAEAASSALALAGQGARLFARIAFALQGMDALALLRERVGRGMLDAPQATAAYARLVAGLLAVVFESADVASDPELSRLLVACFNLMHSKELAGQERATGSGLWAAGAGNEAARTRLLDLQDRQDRGLELFASHAPAALAEDWHRAESGPRHTELQRLRRLLAGAGDTVVLDTGLSRPWFEACTRRIDDLRGVEEQLMPLLRQLCQAKASRLEAELHELERSRRRRGPELDAHHPARRQDAARFLDPPEAAIADAATGLPALDLPPAEPSALDLVQQQARRLQTLSAELDAARASLAERKRIEQAKALLMARHGLSEDEAHQRLRRAAMQQGRRIVQVAEALLGAEGLGRH